MLCSTGVLAQVQTIPVTGLCNTGLTPADPTTGCINSVLVGPPNPHTGGSSVDGNWELATPYPSRAYNVQAPDPCRLTSFVPAWVDTPSQDYYNPMDGLSQYISPLSEYPSQGGWYVYRTSFPVPAAISPSGKYLLTVKGQLLADDQVSAVILQNPSGGTTNCKGVASPSLTNYVADGPGGVFQDWDPVALESTLIARTKATR
jgi:hypothetical protein